MMQTADRKDRKNSYSQLPPAKQTNINRYRHYVWLTFAALLLFRLPGLIVWNPYITGSDSAIYMETAMNLAEGKGFVHSICRYTSDLDELKGYVQTYGQRTQEIKRPPLYIYLLSIIYRLSGKDNFMLGINILNYILYALSLIVFYRYLNRKYPFSRAIPLLSLLWFGTGITSLNYAFGAWMESLSVLLFLVAYTYHDALLEKPKVAVSQMCLFGFFLALLALSKHSVVIFVFAFLGQLLWSRKIRFFGVSALTVLIVAGSWYILRDMLSARVIGNPTHGFPYPGTIIPTNFLTYFINLLTDRPINVLRQIIASLMDIGDLGIIAPFTILYFAGNKRDYAWQTNLLLLVFPLATYLLYGYVLPRYFYPALIPLIPISFVYLIKFSAQYSRVAKLTVIGIVVFVTIILRMASAAEFYTTAFLNGKERKALFLEADGLLKKAGVKPSDMLLTNIVGYNVYSEIGYALLPNNTSAKNRHELFDLYSVDYVLYYVGQPRTLDWADLTDFVDVFSDLERVAKSAKLNYLHLYRVSNGASRNE